MRYFFKYGSVCGVRELRKWPACTRWFHARLPYCFIHRWSCIRVRDALAEACLLKNEECGAWKPLGSALLIMPFCFGDVFSYAPSPLFEPVLKPRLNRGNRHLLMSANRFLDSQSFIFVRHWDVCLSLAATFSLASPVSLLPFEAI